MMKRAFTAITLSWICVLALSMIAPSSQAWAASDEGKNAFIAKDYATALRVWTLEANSGDAAAQNGLGNMLFNGLGVTADRVEAVKLYQKAAAQGNADAQVNIGSLYSYGVGGVVQDKVEATKWYRKAADQGNAQGQFYLGAAYDLGDGVATDKAEGTKWYQKAAAQGHTIAKTVLKLKGIGEEQQKRFDGLRWTSTSTGE